MCPIHKNYTARKESIIFNLAARTDGRNPPSTPITAANISDEIIIDGVIANENCSSEKDVKFNVEIEKN